MPLPRETRKPSVCVEEDTHSKAEMRADVGYNFAADVAMRLGQHQDERILLSLHIHTYDIQQRLTLPYLGLRA